jgi:hypothetical protein
MAQGGKRDGPGCFLPGCFLRAERALCGSSWWGRSFLSALNCRRDIPIPSSPSPRLRDAEICRAQSRSMDPSEYVTNAFCITSIQTTNCPSRDTWHEVLRRSAPFGTRHPRCFLLPLKSVAPVAWAPIHIGANPCRYNHLPLRRSRLAVRRARPRRTLRRIPAAPAQPNADVRSPRQYLTLHPARPPPPTPRDLRSADSPTHPSHPIPGDAHIHLNQRNLAPPRTPPSPPLPISPSPRPPIPASPRPPIPASPRLPFPPPRRPHSAPGIRHSAFHPFARC